MRDYPALERLPGGEIRPCPADARIALQQNIAAALLRPRRAVAGGPYACKRTEFWLRCRSLGNHLLTAASALIERCSSVALVGPRPSASCETQYQDQNGRAHRQGSFLWWLDATPQKTCSQLSIISATYVRQTSKLGCCTAARLQCMGSCRISSDPSSFAGAAHRSSPITAEPGAEQNSKTCAAQSASHWPPRNRLRARNGREDHDAGNALIKVRGRSEA